MLQFVITDHVQTADGQLSGMVYRTDGNVVRFCDEHGCRHRVRAEGLRLMDKRFNWETQRKIYRVNAAVLGRYRR